MSVFLMLCVLLHMLIGFVKKCYCGYIELGKSKAIELGVMDGWCV